MTIIYRNLAILLLVLCTCSIYSSLAFADPLLSNTNYTVTIQKINSDGTVATPSATSQATTDSNGLLSFSFSAVPTNSDANFLLLKVLDSSNLLKKQALVPAPPVSDVNFMGINDMANSQASALLVALAAAGTDDPILTSYALMMLRSSTTLSNSDLVAFGSMGKKAIIASGNSTTPSMEEYLTGTTAGFGNVSTARLNRFKACLIYNNYSTPAGKAQTLRSFSRSYFDANSVASDTSAQQMLEKAGGRMADVFLAAGQCAGVPTGKILAGHQAAGDIANPLMSTMTSTLQTQIQVAATSFNSKMQLSKMANDYVNALHTLGATGTQVTRFIQAVTAMQASSADIDSSFSWFFNNPTDANAQTHSYDSANSVQTAINNLYSTVWNTLTTSIASTDSEITAMRTLLRSTFQNSGSLPQSVGKFINPDSSTTNWSIPQTVLVTWIATQIQNGGSIQYTRDTLAIPANLSWISGWMGNCSGATSGAYDSVSCTNAGGTWTAGRTAFSGPAVLAAFMGLQQDIQIVDFYKQSFYVTNGNNPTAAQCRLFDTQLETNLEHITTLLNGTKNAAGTPFSADEKRAIVKLLLQPDNDQI